MEEFSEIKTTLFVEKCCEEKQTPELILAEVSISIKQEPELIIEDEIETEKIRQYLQKNDITEEDRINLVWHSCITCEERFLSSEDLSLHVQNYHQFEFSELYPTTVDEASKSKQDLQCTQCKKICTSQRQLDDHLKFHKRKFEQSHHHLHSGGKSFKCEQCNRSFKQSSNLKTHMRTHTGEKPFKCDHCNRSFGDKSTLQHHLRTHTGEKPFKCDSCNSSFARNYSLQMHMRMHSGEKPFKCVHCGRSFAQSGGLQRHVITHSGEKPFKCVHCDRSFTQSGSLQRHVRTHSGEKPFKC